MLTRPGFLLAQIEPITVPDYSYGAVYSEQGRVSQSGIATPGPNGAYSQGEDARASGIFNAHGFRWWGYPSYILLICGDFPPFNYPGAHGIWDMSSLGCANPPIGYMASWGGVITDPDKRTIWSISGAKNENGPTTQYCVDVPWLPGGKICYPPPSTWGYGSSYGYLRKVVVVQSTGTLQPGDPVNIKASIEAQRTHEGEGTASSMGVLFLNKLSEAEWYKWGMGREYLRWGDVEDIMGTPSMANSMLALLKTEENNTDDSTTTVAVGDIIILELMFNNTIKHANPGPSGEAEGWSGEKPDNIFTSPVYTRTDSIKSLIKKHGNTLTYDLISLTTGAILSPLTPDGPNVDEDNDGISDTREKGADGNNNTWDGNADGIPDYQQADVASFHTYDGLNYVTLVVPDGTELSQVKVTDNPSASDTPADAQFPWGFFDFSIDGLDPGEAVTVTLILHEATSVSKYYKYGITPDNLEPHWYDFTYDGQTGAQINGSIITLHFVDGLRGDEDITANGSIKEPGGPAITGATNITEITENAGISVYPNPAADNITLKLNNILPGNNYLFKIFSGTGEMVNQKVINVCGSNEEFNISTANLSSGLYFITLSGGKINYTTKFIKLK
ncbi:MAG: T9SS type A sorting domain-containing protein [Bacteroidales bacterium]|nr:T9SS type A sorting domain-containing protein [Bacteroidales bacterium]